MAQITVRLDEELAQQVKTHAAGTGRSVNNWLVALMSAATDPELEDDDLARTRARLERAGLLYVPERTPTARPSAQRLAQARRAAGAGKELAAFVADGRD